MKGKTLSLAFAALFLGIAVSLAGLDATPILNHSFESVNDGNGATNDWGYVIDDWYENEQPYETDCFFELGTPIGLVGDATLWVGTQTGGKFYQSVGTVDDSVSYEISALIGARGGNFGTGSFSLYSSTADAATNAIDGVQLSSFATLLSTINVTTNNGVSTGDLNVYTVTVNLPTGTGYAGEVLWLELGSVANRCYFDNIAIAASSPATAPGPTWTTNAISGTQGVNGMAYSDSLANLATDPDGDAITYAKTTGNAWLIVGEGGVLSGSPDVLGTNVFTVTATDGTGIPAEATLTIHVRATEPPVWDEDPITGANAIVGEAYTNSIAGKATDPDGGTITYSLDSTYTWLSVASDGTTTGLPEAGHVGVNSFTVLADDGVDTPASVILNIEVFASVAGNSTAISVNFTEGHANQQLAMETEAGLAGYVYTNWNNTAGANGTLGSLINSAGATTAAEVIWLSNNMWGDANANGDANAIPPVGDAQIARGYLDDGNYEAAQEAAWTVTDVPFDTYDVVVYLGTDTEGGTYLPFVANGITNYPSGTKHRYTNPNWDASNTIVFTGLTNDTLTVNGFNRYQIDVGTARGSATGFQIINVAYTTGDPVADLVITGPVSSGTQMVLTWTGELDKMYGVETNSNLIVADWQTCETGLVGNGGSMTMTNAIGPNQTFYRVISE